MDAYIANAEPVKAVDYIKRIMSERGTTTSAPSSLESRPSSTPSDARPASSSADQSSVDSVALDLLLAKTYNGWNGHDKDAIAVYEALIKRVPADFRGYLAKGLFLKDHGQKADAERMFIQGEGPVTPLNPLNPLTL